MQVSSTLLDFDGANIGQVTVGRQYHQIFGIRKIKCQMFCTGQSLSVDVQHT